MQPIIYLCQVSACLGIFYMCYYLMLRKLTFFTINRWYLMATLAFSFIIPLISVTVNEAAVPVVVQKVVQLNRQLPTTNYTITSIAKDESSVFDWWQMAEIAYLAIAGILLIKMLTTVAVFFYRIKRSTISTAGRVHIIKGNKKITNGSFFNYIMLDDEGLNQTETAQVIAHEMLHVKLYHSVDRMIVKLVQVVLWFNPFVYLYARAIEENHEFEVDHRIGQQANKSSYADMLLHLSVGRQDVLFNSFSAVPLKRRIRMLFTKPSNHMKKTIYLLVLPAVMVSCLAFAQLKNKPQENKYSVVAGIEDIKGNIKVFIDDKPYSSDILYKISSDCIKTTGYKNSYVSSDPKDAKIKYAGVIHLTTQNGKITYMSKWELDSLKKVRAIPKHQFYTRLELRDNKGKRFDEVIIRLANGEVSASVDAGKKVGFYVGDVYYTEKQAKQFTDEKIQSFGDEYGTETTIKPADRNKGVAAIFRFQPKTASVDTKKGQIKAAAKLSQQRAIKQRIAIEENATPDDKTLVAEAQGTVSEKVTNDAAAPFFSRFHFAPAGSKSFDVAAFKLTDGPKVTVLSSDVGVNDKVGIWIDGKFYNEAAIKKLTPEKIATLTVDDNPNPDPSTIEKVANGGHNSVPIRLKTKSI